MAWKTGDLDRMQRLFCYGPSNRSLPSVGLSFPVSQPRSSPWASVEPYWRAFLKGGCLGVRVAASGSERVKTTLFLPRPAPAGAGCAGLAFSPPPCARLWLWAPPAGREQAAPQGRGTAAMGVEGGSWAPSAGPEEGDMSHCSMRAQDDRDPSPAAVAQKRHGQGA